MKTKRLSVKEILDELNLLEAKANKNKLVCNGCNHVHPKLFTLIVKNKTILICESCKESLNGILDNDNKEAVYEIVSEMFNDIFNFRVENNFGSSGDSFGMYDSARYNEDHKDC